MVGSGRTSIGRVGRDVVDGRVGSGRTSIGRVLLQTLLLIVPIDAVDVVAVDCSDQCCCRSC